MNAEIKNLLPSERQTLLDIVLSQGQYDAEVRQDNKQSYDEIETNYLMPVIIPSIGTSNQQCP